MGYLRDWVTPPRPPLWGIQVVVVKERGARRLKYASMQMMLCLSFDYVSAPTLAVLFRKGSVLGHRVWIRRDPG